MKSIKLTFDKATTAKQFYSPGDVLSGFCEIEMEQQKPPVTISLQIEGRAKVFWTEAHFLVAGTGKSTIVVPIIIPYSSEQTLVTMKQQFTVTEESLVTPGHYQFPFSFKLPFKGLKTSFEGKYGSVRYSIDARPVGTWLPNLFKPKDKIRFTVVENVETAPFSNPVGATNSKSVCCLFLKSGPLTIDAECNHSAFCPGDLVTMTAEFSNLSSRKVKPYMELVQISSFLAGGKARVSTKTFEMKPLNDDNILPSIVPLKGGSSFWNGFQFEMPQVSPSIDCENIKVGYFIEVGLKVPWGTNLKVRLPVVVGTIPHSTPRKTADLPPSYFATVFGQQNKAVLPLTPDEDGKSALDEEMQDVNTPDFVSIKL